MDSTLALYMSFIYQLLKGILMIFQGVACNTHFSFSRSKYFHLLSNADLRIHLWLDDEIDRKIDVTAIQFLMVQNRQQTRDWILIGSGTNGLGIQVLIASELIANDRAPSNCITFTNIKIKYWTLKHWN